MTTCTATSATAASASVPCSASTTNRGQRGDRQRATSATPSASAAVSRISAAAPVPRERYQSAEAARITPALRRPARDPDHCAVLRAQPRRQPALGEPAGGGRAEHDRRRAGDVGVDAGRRGHRDRPPRRGRGRAGRRVDDVVPAGPAAHRRARRGQPAAGDLHRLAGPPPSRGGRRPRARASRAGAGPARGEVAAEVDQHAAARRRGGRPRGAIGGERLRRGAQVERHARGHPDRPVARPAGPRATPAPAPRPAARAAAAREVAVVPRGDDGSADGRVDRPAGQPGRPQRGRHRLRQQRAHAHRPPGRAVEPRELAVGAEAGCTPRRSPAARPRPPRAPRPARRGP